MKRWSTGLIASFLWGGLGDDDFIGQHDRLLVTTVPGLMLGAAYTSPADGYGHTIDLWLLFWLVTFQWGQRTWQPMMIDPALVAKDDPELAEQIQKRVEETTREVRAQLAKEEEPCSK